MTLLELRHEARHCAAMARRHLYMTCDRDSADRWARAAMGWLEVMRMQIKP